MYHYIYTMVEVVVWFSTFSGRLFYYLNTSFSLLRVWYCRQSRCLRILSHSMCMQTLESVFEYSTSYIPSPCFPVVKLGIWKWAKLTLGYCLQYQTLYWLKLHLQLQPCPQVIYWRFKYRMTALHSDMPIFCVRARCKIRMARYDSKHASQSLSDKPFLRIHSVLNLKTSGHMCPFNISNDSYIIGDILSVV